MTSREDPHGRNRIPRDDDDDDDPAERMLKQSGCLELHYKLQECMVDNRDWRKCQQHVKDFKKCVEQNKNKNKNQNGASA